MDINTNITALPPKAPSVEIPAVVTSANLSYSGATANAAKTNVVPVLPEEAIKDMIDNGEASLTETFTVNRSTFAIFRLPDGKVYSRVRDLETGDVKYFPTVDSTSYRRAVDALKGQAYEEEV